MNGYQIVHEAIAPTTSVKFIIHNHKPRSGSEHYDFRFVDPKNSKMLHSFAAPKNFLDTIKTKTVLAKTRDHDIRWLTLKSYRLKDIESGTVKVMKATDKYFELDFNGKRIHGRYKLFHLKNSRRSDRWLLIKAKSK